MVAERTGAVLTYTIDLAETRRFDIGLLPRFPDAGDAVALDVAIDGLPARRIDVPRITGSPAWSQGVLDNLLTVPAERLERGRHRITITARSTGIALDRLTLVLP